MLLRERCSKLSSTFPENQEIRQRITAETICSVKSSATFTGSKEAGHSGHLGLRMNSNTAHDVVHRRPNFHRGCRDVDIGKLLELVIHARQLLLYVFRRVGNF